VTVVLEQVSPKTGALYIYVFQYMLWK